MREFNIPLKWLITESAFGIIEVKQNKFTYII